MVEVWPTVLVGVPLGVAAIPAVKLVFDVVTVRSRIRPVKALPKALNYLDAFDLMRARVFCRPFDGLAHRRGGLRFWLRLRRVNTTGCQQSTLVAACKRSFFTRRVWGLRHVGSARVLTRKASFRTFAKGSTRRRITSSASVP